jgi:hypothetical protein
MIELVSLTALIVAGCMLAAFFAGYCVASACPASPPTQEEIEMSKVTEAFAAYVAYRDQKEAAAVEAAVDAEKANHQAEVEAAVAASEDADAAAISAAVPVVTVAAVAEA